MNEDYQHQIDGVQKQIDDLKTSLEAVSNEYYLNNFSTSQDFQKYSRFNVRLKVPHYASDPTTAEVGEIIEVGGKLKICSSANVFTICGTQS
jgi:hypothetical protein